MPAPFLANVLLNETSADGSTGFVFETTMMLIPEATGLIENAGHNDISAVHGITPSESFLDTPLGIVVVCFGVSIVMTFLVWVLYRWWLQKHRRGYGAILDDETEQEDDDRLIMLGP